jgi:membrane fusion protein, multidrug efflux system
MPVHTQLVIGLKSKRFEPRSSHQYPQFRSLGLTVALLIACAATACSRSNSTRSEDVRPSKPMTVAAENILEVRTFAGRVDPSRQVELAFQVAGVLVNFPVKAGQKVSKGQIIAQLRSAEFQARLVTVQGQLEQARAALEALRLGESPEQQLQRETQERVTGLILANTRTEFGRYARLVRLGDVSRVEYERAETNFRVAEEEHNAALQLLGKGRTPRKEDVEAQEGTVRGLGGQVAEAKLQLEDSTLRAPFDGVIAQRFVDEGQSITVNKPVIRLQSVAAVDIVVDVPETVLTSDICSPGIVGMVAEIHGIQGRQFPVRIKEVEQVPDQKTQRFPVRYELLRPSGVTVLPGMTATVSVSFRRPRLGGSCILTADLHPRQAAQGPSSVVH